MSATMSSIESSKEQFAEKLIGILNGGALSLMISIGHRTGLFDVMSALPPSTSDELARAANLNERYVREWLGAMVTGGIASYDPDTARYSLPAEHAASLTRAAAADNIAVFAQYVAVLGAVEDNIVECFRHGGGVPYSAYARFHDVMAEDSGQSVVPALIDLILPLVPGLVDRLNQGINVLDVGCGSGRALNLMAREFPNSQFTGYDLSDEAIGRGRDEAGRLGLTNIHFEKKDLTHFEVDQKFDFVTAFDAIHDQARPDQVLAGINRVLGPGGVFLMQDIAGTSHVHQDSEHPLAPLLYTVSCMHCMTVSLAQGGMGLGAMWGKEQAIRMLGEAGFADVEVNHLAHDIQNCYYVARKS